METRKKETIEVRIHWQWKELDQEGSTRNHGDNDWRCTEAKKLY